MNPQFYRVVTLGGLTPSRIRSKIISTLRKVTPSCESDQYVRALSLDDRISLKARSVPGLSPNEVLASRDSAFHTSREWQGCNPGIHPLTVRELPL